MPTIWTNPDAFSQVKFLYYKTSRFCRATDNDIYYSETSIARTRIARIPDRTNTLADSMFRFFAIFSSYYCCGCYFYKPESPEVRIKFALRAILACKNSTNNNNMSSKWQRNETSSQPVCSSDQVFELSVLELARFYCIDISQTWYSYHHNHIIFLSYFLVPLLYYSISFIFSGNHKNCCQST